MNKNYFAIYKPRLQVLPSQFLTLDKLQQWWKRNCLPTSIDSRYKMYIFYFWHKTETKLPHFVDQGKEKYDTQHLLKRLKPRIFSLSI